ncbi:MAG: EamA family transporter [Anaerolineae bacterium]|nr:EamA family transporter [Anaerolineae bacterium]
MTSNRPSRWLLVAAFAAIYLIWGSSYIAIHFAIQTIPPFLMTGFRFASAGVLLIGWAMLRGTPLPTRANWRAAAVVGGIMFLLNNSTIVWAEGHGVPSGIVAVLVATVPMWIVVLTWLKPGGTFPGSIVIAGLALGFVGIIVLLNPDSHMAVNPIGAVGVLFGSFAWAYGSLYSKTAPLPKSAILSIGMQLLSGGVMQLVVSAALGELGQFDIAQVSLTSFAATIYLAVVSSIIAYSAFVWLMQVVAPEKVATYAYVNPVVAVFLGWLLASEPLTPRTLGGTAIIILAVVLITVYRGRSLPLLNRAKVAKAAP